MGLSNSVNLMIMKHGIPETFRGIVFEKATNAKEFFLYIYKEIKKCFVKSEKAETSTIPSNLISIKYKGK